MSLDLTIYQLVASNLPAGFTVTETYVDTRLKYWQLFLRNAAEIPEDVDFYDMDIWADLPDSDKWLILLSYCITYDIFLLILAGNFMSAGKSEDNQGVVKKIVTGPTEVEYHDTMTALAAIIKAMGGPNGLFDQFLSLACAFANQLGVKLPFCRDGYRARVIIGKKPLLGVRYFNYIIKKSSKRRY